jgi:hypothetical protein
MQSIVPPPHKDNAEIARCFLRLANLDNGALERLNRYEATLWRQVGRILFTLDVLRPGERDGSRLIWDVLMLEAWRERWDTAKPAIRTDPISANALPRYGSAMP